MITFLIATSGRPTLADALASIECWPGDEILVAGQVEAREEGPIRYLPCALGRDWGSKERNYAMPYARGRYLAHLDDDDRYAPGHRALMADAIERHPTGPTLFRMQYPNGSTLWRDRVFRFGNIGTPMILTPNDPKKLGHWRERQIGGDFFFLHSSKWKPSEMVWRPEVVAHLGHNL